MEGTLKSLVRYVIVEALERMHFSDRMRERIMDPSAISPDLDTRSIQNVVPFLKRLNFPEEATVAINVFRSNTIYRSAVNNEQPIFGNNLWVIVRDNSLVTLFFRKDNNPPDDVQYRIMVEKLWDLVDSKGTYDLTMQDLKSASGSRPSAAPTRKRGLDLQLPIISIKGSKWYADIKKNLFMYVKNINKVLTFDAVFEKLTNSELEDIMDQLSDVGALTLSESRREL